MSGAIQNLTDKEKEALRLLVEGHDAKSSSALLGISVYTLNDRLRNARRKLQVSSSREAARILRDAEDEAPQTSPQNLARISLGIADEPVSGDTEALNQHSQNGPPRFTWLAGGMLIMSIIIAAAIFAAVSTSGEESDAPRESASSPSAQTTNSVSQETQASLAAEARAKRFIGAVDAGDWKASWDAAGPFFQSQASLDEWVSLIQPVRTPLGKAEERRLTNVQKVQTLPGAPDGDYEILQYNTKFSGSGMMSTETVILVRNEGDFDIAGYFIR